MPNNQHLKQIYKIAVIPGDGIGPEIMDQALKILKAVEHSHQCQFEYKELLAGGAAWDKFGKHLPKMTLQECQNSDAILFGAVGGPADAQDSPKWQNAEKNVILGLRKHFDLFANLRPIKNHETCNIEHKTRVDFVIVRELIGGIYFGKHKIMKHKTHNMKQGFIAEDIMRYSSEEIERILRVGFLTAQKRQKRLILVDKANVLETSKLWRKIAENIKNDYNDVHLDYMFIDNAAYQLAKDPKQFDVIVTENMFGDILSDEAAVWAQSLGMIPSASLGAGTFGLYEPAHGSAPKYTGKDIANPVAMILSAALMLRHSFGLENSANIIEKAVAEVINKGYGTPDLKPRKVVGTQEMGDLITKAL